jgi:hypothetical protein
MVNGANFSVIRDRVSVDDMLARESLPEWFRDDGGARREARE